MRAIDADALITQIEAEVEQMEDTIFKLAAYGAINDVKHQPTIEPQRKKGEWITHPDDTFDEWFCCSVCHKGLTMFDGTYNYCPNCGADMRGDSDGSD